MPLQITTTTGTLAPPDPAPVNHGQTITQTGMGGTDYNTLVNVQRGLELSQEVNDFIRVVATGMGTDARAAMMAVYNVLKDMIRSNNDIVAERVLNP